MKAFLAIAGLTIRHAVRSHIFQLLLGLLLLCVVLIPGTAGDSTAAGFIQSFHSAADPGALLGLAGMFCDVP